jgi:outer membrane protein TolC
VPSNLKSVQQQIDEIRSLISDAQQTLAQANYALSTLLERLDEEDPEEPRWSRPRGPHDARRPG